MTVFPPDDELISQTFHKRNKHEQESSKKEKTSSDALFWRQTFEENDQSDLSW